MDCKMYNILKGLIAASLLILMQTGVRAQENAGNNGIPDDVMYLMPSFADGMVYLTGQRPAQGKLNICALDNTLRFIDNKGTELSAADHSIINKVRIDTVWFLRNMDAFYRMYPVAVGTGVAVRRDLHILQDVKQGAYGTTSQTSAINQKSVLYADGVAYNLNSDKKIGYRVSETMFLYKDDSVYPLNKRNLRKLFPSHKAEIDAWFQSGNTLPTTPDELIPLLRLWAE